jgi:hypothetical protein
MARGQGKIWGAEGKIWGRGGGIVGVTDEFRWRRRSRNFRFHSLPTKSIYADDLHTGSWRKRTHKFSCARAFWHRGLGFDCLEYKIMILIGSSTCCRCIWILECFWQGGDFGAERLRWGGGQESLACKQLRLHE